MEEDNVHFSFIMYFRSRARIAHRAMRNISNSIYEFVMLRDKFVRACARQREMHHNWKCTVLFLHKLSARYCL